MTDYRYKDVHPVIISELNKNEKEFAEDLQKYYKHVRRCVRCRLLYGSDFDEDGLCSRKSCTPYGRAKRISQSKGQSSIS